MKDLSIIVPIYNGSKYIKNCINNLKNIRNINYEVILIDDCSCDDTKDIVNTAIKGNKNIIYIRNKERLGVSASRNIGIKKAKGSYITFFDVDDKIDPQAYSKVIDILKKDKSDVIIYNYKELIEEKNYCINSKYRYKNCFLNKDESLKLFLLDKISPSSCDKVYKKDLLKNIEFDSNLEVGEDILFCLKVFLKSNKNSFINENYYTYVKNNSSVMHSLANHLMQFKEVLSLINPKEEERLVNNFKGEFEYFKLQMITRGVHAISDNVNKENKKKAIELLKLYINKKDLKKIIKCKYFPKSIRLEIHLLKLFGIRFHLFLTPLYKFVKNKIR